VVNNDGAVILPICIVLSEFTSNIGNPDISFTENNEPSKLSVTENNSPLEPCTLNIGSLVLFPEPIIVNTESVLELINPVVAVKPPFIMVSSCMFIGEQPYKFVTYKSVIQLPDVLPVNGVISDKNATVPLESCKVYVI
jgi:hypothetical protein